MGPAKNSGWVLVAYASIKKIVREDNEQRYLLGRKGRHTVRCVTLDKGPSTT